MILRTYDVALMLPRKEFRFFSEEEGLVDPSPDEVPSSSGLGHLVLIQEIAGSNPAGITRPKLQIEKNRTSCDFFNLWSTTTNMGVRFSPGGYSKETKLLRREEHCSTLSGDFSSAHRVLSTASSNCNDFTSCCINLNSFNDNP